MNLYYKNTIIIIIYIYIYTLENVLGACVHHKITIALDITTS